MGIEWLLSLLTNIIMVKTDAKSKTSVAKEEIPTSFEMPLHYPRYVKADYEEMEEWRLDFLLKQYGLQRYVNGNSLGQKRSHAISTFLWPNQL